MPNAANYQLNVAAMAGQLSVLKEWKKRTETQNEEVDFNKATAFMGCTPLHEACRYGRLECVKYLVESYRAKVDCNDYSGSTPLHRASSNGHLECVKYLIESCGASINRKNNDGWTPLHWACHEGHLECVKYLIESCGANINGKDDNGNTPLHHACMDDHVECMHYLIESANADINIQNNSNNTPLDFIDATLRIIFHRLDHLSHRNSQLQQRLQQNEQEIEQLKQQLERGEEEKKQKDQENEQLKRQWEQQKEEMQHMLLKSQRENEQLKQQLEREEEEKKQKDQENKQLKRQLKQHLKISIDQDRRAAIRTEAITDITFLCGQGYDQQAIKANSAVLMVTVPSIQALINSGIQHQCAHDGAHDVAHGGTEPIQTTIPLPNLQPKHVRYVLQCIYTGEISFNNNTHNGNANADASNQPTPILTGQDDLQQLILVANEVGFWRLKFVFEADLACKYVTEET